MSFIKGKLNSIDTKLYMVGMYEHYYNINDYTKEDEDPFIKFKFNECEDVTQNSLFDEVVDKYIVNNIYNTFGITFQDFINLPGDVIKKLIDRKNVYESKKSSISNEIERELK